MDGLGELLQLLDAQPADVDGCDGVHGRGEVVNHG